MDPDRVSSVITVRALEKMGYEVESVADAAGGLETIQQRQIDLVICEATLPDIPATSFIAMSQRIYAPSPLPVLVVTMDLHTPVRLELLRAGALECLAKPVEAEELRLRVSRALRDHEPAELRFGAVQLGGDLGSFSLTDVLTLLDLAKHTGRLEIASSREPGVIELVDGQILHAELGRLQGIEALAVILRVARGWFRVQRAEPTPRRTIEGTTTQSMLDATVLDANQRRTPSMRIRTLEELGVSKAQLSPPPARLARLARRLAPLIQDPHRLGELELSPRDSRPDDEDTLTLTWFGEINEAISTLWEISAPLSPQLLHDLRTPNLALHWRFHGRDRDQLAIRVIELDEPSPAWFHLSTDLALLAAPPTGAFVVDPSVRAYVLTHKTPTLVLAPEDESARLLSPAPFTQVVSRDARLVDLRGQVRTVLADAIRMCIPS
ncbi:MAG: DUF4388 domain-containing protein [Kofleriaceae bacterium]